LRGAGVCSGQRGCRRASLRHSQSRCDGAGARAHGADGCGDCEVLGDVAARAGDAGTAARFGNGVSRGCLTRWAEYGVHGFIGGSVGWRSGPQTAGAGHAGTFRTVGFGGLVCDGDFAAAGGILGAVIEVFSGGLHYWG